MKFRLFLFILLVNSTFSFSQSSNYALAENYFRNNEFEKAAQLYKDLVTKSPYNTSYLTRLTSCYQETNNFKKVDQLITGKLKNRSSLIYLNVILGYNYEKQQLPDKAEQFYKKAIKGITKKSGYGGTVANLFKGYNKLDLAIEAYKKASKVNKNAHYGFQIAQIYGEKGDFEFMFQEYVDYLDKNDSYLNVVKRYTSRYITDDGEDKNNILFKKVLLKKSVSNPKNVWNDLLSWLFTKQKDYGKALIQFKALYARNPDKLASIHQLGKIAFENDDFETAKKCFDIIIKDTSYERDKFNAILMNLKIAVATKDPEVDQRFQDIFATYGVNKATFPIQVAHADYLIFSKNKPEEAKVTLEKALTFAKNSYQKARVQLKLADALVYQNKFNKALIYFSRIQTRFKNHQLGQEARFKVAQTSYFKNDFKWSKAQLKVLKGSSSQLIANDAADLFLTISDNEPKDSLPSGLHKYAQADLLAYQNKNKEAITLLTDVLKEYKGQSIEDEALFKQADLFLRLKKYEEAISNYLKITEMDPQGILVDDAYYKLGELYKNMLNNPEKASEYYQKIIFDYPSSIYLVDARKKFRKLRGDTI